MKVRQSALKDVVDVATRTGEGATGPTYDAMVRVRCEIDETRRMVRDSNGDEAVSEATLTLHPNTRVVDADGLPVATVDPMDVFAPESTVTIDGRASRVLSTKRRSMRGYPVLIEVTCA